MSADHFVTVDELATELRLSPETLYSFRGRGVGPKSMKFGRRVVYRRSDVDAWLAEQEQATARGGEVA